MSAWRSGNLSTALVGIGSNGMTGTQNTLWTSSVRTICVTSIVVGEEDRLGIRRRLRPSKLQQPFPIEAALQRCHFTFVGLEVR